MLGIDEKWAILEGSAMKHRPFAYDSTVDPREIPRYSFAEAALFVQVPETTLRSWVTGRAFPVSKGKAAGFSAPLIAAADVDAGLLSFYNLTEAHILKSTRQRDEVPMKAVRDALDYVAVAFPSHHPLITPKFETEGSSLFIKQLETLINASKGQLGFHAILHEYLSRIDRDSQGLPITIYPVNANRPDSRAVAIKYGVSSGAPVVSGTGVLVSALWGRYHAGDSPSDLAADYDIDERVVEDAIAYLEAA